MGVGVLDLFMMPFVGSFGSSPSSIRGVRPCIRAGAVFASSPFDLGPEAVEARVDPRDIAIGAEELESVELGDFALGGDDRAGDAVVLAEVGVAPRDDAAQEGAVARVVEEEADLLGHGLGLVPSPVGRDDEDVGAADPQEPLDTGPQGDADRGPLEPFDEAPGVLGGGGEIDEVGGFLEGEFADGERGEQFGESCWHAGPFNGRPESSTTRSCGPSVFEAPYLVDTITQRFKLRQDVTFFRIPSPRPPLAEH